MKKTIIAAAALAAMAACNQNIIESSIPAEEYGYINLGVTADTEMVITKAVTSSDATDISGYNVTLKQGDAVQWTKDAGDIQDSDLKVPAGTYTIEVENLTSEEAHPAAEKGSVRVSGSNTVTVKAGLPTECPVTCSPVNSKISFNYTAEFKEVFPTAVVEAGADSRILELAMLQDTEGTATLDAAYFDQAAIDWTLTATNANNVVKTYAKSQALTAGKWTVVTFTVGDTAGSINVTITVNGEITDVVEVSEEIDPLGGVEAE